jgi:eukaryotic-like serine/threonine-protein kinase
VLYEMLTGQAPFSGENVNAIMYQTLNSVPPPPSSLSPNVPEMLNFIVAKALAKKLEHRYQDTKEFAADLYACRDRLPRPASAREGGKPVAPATSLKQDVISTAKHVDTSEDESKPVATLGLSSSFDSAAATIRLAALTGSKEDVEEFSRTFKMPIPDLEEINKAGLPSSSVASKIEPPIFSKPKSAPVAPTIQLASIPAEQGKNASKNNMIFIIIILLVLSGLVVTMLLKR